VKVIIYIFIIFLFACQFNPGNNRECTEKDTHAKEDQSLVTDSFSIYLSNFKELNLPVVIKPCRDEPKNLVSFDGQKFKKYRKDIGFAYGQIPTNGDYIAIITLGISDCLLPVLTTYKTDGQIIDEKTISIGYCGFDCGYDCREFMTLEEDYVIFVSDTINTYECDSLGYEILGTREHYVIYKKGRLLNNGRIELTDEMKNILTVDL